MNAYQPPRNRFQIVNAAVIALFSVATALAITVTFVGAFGGLAI